MTGFTERQRQDLINRYDALEREGNRSLYGRAVIMKIVLDAYGGKENAFMDELRDGWGVKEVSTRDLRFRMACGVELVPDTDVWVAIGWIGVQRLYLNMNPADYVSIRTQIIGAANGNGVVRGVAAFVDRTLVIHGTPRRIKRRSKNVAKILGDMDHLVKNLIEKFGEEILGLQLDRRSKGLIQRHKPRRAMRP